MIYRKKDGTLISINKMSSYALSTSTLSESKIPVSVAIYKMHDASIGGTASTLSESKIPTHKCDYSNNYDYFVKVSNAISPEKKDTKPYIFHPLYHVKMHDAQMGTASTLQESKIPAHK